VLDLLSAAGARDMPVRALVRAAAVFEITENSLRVALARLVAEGKVERNERGLYGLSPAALAVQQHVTSWFSLDSRVVSWNGQWVAVATSGLDRRQRSQVRRRRRALEFLGMRQLAPELWVRPDNLRGGLSAVRSRLTELGMDDTALVFALHGLDPAAERRALALWDGPALERGYAKAVRELEKSGRQLQRLPLEQALVECFALGGRVIRLLAYDPLLPEPIVAQSARKQLLEAMRQYDRAGRNCWKKFLRAQRAPALESLLEFKGAGRAA